MAASGILLTLVAPSLASCFSVIVYMSPLAAILKLRKARDLGDFNPIPYPVILANCVAWLVYGIVTDDYFVSASSEVGLMIGLFYTISVYGLAEEKVKTRILTLLMAFAALLSVVALVGALGKFPHDKLKLLWGLTGNFVLFLYYAAPLSTVVAVFKQKSSASIYWPYCLMNCINAGLWMAYGVAKNDPFLWVSTLIGASLASFQLALCFFFPQRRPPRTTGPGTPNMIPMEELVGAESTGGVAGTPIDNFI